MNCMLQVVAWKVSHGQDVCGRLNASGSTAIISVDRVGTVTKQRGRSPAPRPERVRPTISAGTIATVWQRQAPTIVSAQSANGRKRKAPSAVHTLCRVL